MGRHINQSGLDLIKEFEGFEGEAYLCPANVPTIGYGHTRGVEMGQTCTKAEAEKWLREDVAEAESAVYRLVTVPLTDNQFSALVSFTFNLGAGNLRKSTLLRLLNEGGYGYVPGQLLRWNKAGGRKLSGLTRRRRAEGELWLATNN